MSTHVYRTELTPLEFLRRGALVFPEKIAVVHGERRYTYRRFAERVGQLAAGLVARGLAAGDRVAFLSPNTPALLEAHYGVPAAGGILVSVNIRLTSAEIEYILRHSGSRWLFVDDELHPQVAGLDLDGISIIRIADSGAPGDPYEDFLAAAASVDLPAVPEHEEDLIAINYTSGTTGRQKGVMCTHRGAYLTAMSQVITTRLTSDSVFLWTLPMFHCNGWCYTWAVTAAGGTHVCLRAIEPGRVWELFEQESVTHYNGAPTVHIMLVNHPRAHRLGHEVTVATGGAPPSPTLLEQMQALNLRPMHVYGLTETYGPYALCEWHREWDALPTGEQARILARQGQGHVAAEAMRVVDETMRDVPRDGKTMGEVVMRGNIVMKGYFDDPEATDKAFAGGWFHSGDLGVWHADGYVELRDRAKDVIISGGENISTIEVEQTVARHPAVLECAVIAIPDDKWGERPKAFVTLKEGQEASAREIVDFCREHLAHFKCPSAVEIGDLPKTSTGKVQKFVLRQREWQGHDKRIH